MNNTERVERLTWFYGEPVRVASKVRQDGNRDYAVRYVENLDDPWITGMNFSTPTEALTEALREAESIIKAEGAYEAEYKQQFGGYVA